MLMACSPQRLTRPMYSLIVAALLMATGWAFRWIIFMEAQEVPKYGAGLYLYKMPMGSYGLLGMLGVLGLCIALIVIISWFDRKRGVMGQSVLLRVDIVGSSIIKKTNN